MTSVTTDKDTICAVVTAPGRSGVGIVRISGTKSLEIAQSILGLTPEARHAHYTDFKNRDGNTLDQGVALYFPNPNSFTGEDVLELQGHGGEIVLNGILKEALAQGCRLARPGEFSERAFLNGKMDLLQAEAIADLINSNSEQAAKSALRTLQGDFSKLIQSLVIELIKTRVEVEATIDFSDEDIDFVKSSGVVYNLKTIQNSLHSIFKQAQQGALLKEGMQVVIAGKPNAGKSSLLNALSGNDVAIVTDIAGTTRDALSESIQLDGLPLHITDTAGLRKSNDVVEQEGIRRAYKAMENADRLILLLDIATESTEFNRDDLILSIQEGNSGIRNGRNSEETLSKLLTTFLEHEDIDVPVRYLDKTSIVLNKTDLLTNLTGQDETVGTGIDTKLLQIPIEKLTEELNTSTTSAVSTIPVIPLSAKQGQGLNLLTKHLKDCVGYQASEEGSFVARERHLIALRNCESSVIAALENLEENHALEFAAEDLRLAQTELSKITGEFTSDDLLGEIFSSFCIGK